MNWIGLGLIGLECRLDIISMAYNLQVPTQLATLQLLVLFKVKAQNFSSVFA